MRIHLYLEESGYNFILFLKPVALCSIMTGFIACILLLCSVWLKFVIGRRLMELITSQICTQSWFLLDPKNQKRRLTTKQCQETKDMV
ncbi:hypothetical protein HNY73_010266 [Argiope bruennichi]|uniref:Uncharacterized protein n=1 Tax=Argiope bruennichi TaxID=94029 RepID=A0A8T0F0F3_ARGBR|nr:hypothetical protein HNY73_010266 [Argiope bruennichi]